ncbi:MAG: DUF1015 domain-containing protein [Myxococcaceae bacterium]
MALVRPFRALRPPRELARKIAAPPYDVVNTDEARAHAQGNEQSFFHISRPEIDLPPGTDEHSAAVYEQGQKALKDFEKNGWLVKDPEPLLYIYRQKMGDHVQTGIVGCASVEEYDRGLVKKHEHTRQDKEDDRTKHIEALGANDEPVFLTYRAESEIDDVFAQVTKYNPEYDFVTEDGISHTVWIVRGESTKKLVILFNEVSFLYIADGHHRSAAASRVHKTIREKRRTGEHEYFLSVIFPHNQMKVLDYNRVVKDLNGLDTESFLQRVMTAFELETSGQKRPAGPHRFGMYLDGKWYQLTARPTTLGSTSAGLLDVAILQRNLLGSVLGIGDPRTDSRIAFVGGIRGVEELERKVSSGEYKVAFAMHPTSLDQLMAIADAGQVMPPKSTWFEPKLRSGLFVHTFT